MGAVVTDNVAGPCCFLAGVCLSRCMQWYLMCVLTLKLRPLAKWPVDRAGGLSRSLGLTAAFPGSVLPGVRGLPIPHPETVSALTFLAFEAAPGSLTPRAGTHSF